MRPASIRSLRPADRRAPAGGRVRGRAATAIAAGLILAAIAGLAILLFGGGGGGAQRGGAPARVVPRATAPSWVTGWATAQIRPPGALGDHGLGPGTVRILVASQAGGDAVRIELSNQFGDRPIRLGAVTVGIAARSGLAANPRRVTFARHPGVGLAPGARVLSDPVALAVPQTGATLAVNLWLPSGTGALTAHPGAAIPVFATSGDHTADRSSAAGAHRLPVVPLLSAVVVRAPESAGTLVVIGGSLAEGAGQALASGLAGEAAHRPAGHRVAVVDEALAGNRVLSGTPGTGPALADRLSSDALALPGVRGVVVLAGGEDLAAPDTGAGAGTAARLEKSYAGMIRAAGRAGVSLYLGTLPPPGGGVSRGPSGSDHAQAAREEVNGWIRTAFAARSGPGSGAALDFDALLRDPRDWRRLRPGYGSTASSLPSRAGYRAMARYAAPPALGTGVAPGPRPTPTLASAQLPAGATAMLDVGAGPPGPAFAPGAVGLSIEASVLSGPTLDPARGDLARITRLLGPGVLRVAGDAADLSFWTATGERAPRWAQATLTPADLSRLAALTRATGWRVLLTVNLGHFDPARAASEAAAAKRALGRSLVGIEVGNEPDRYVLQKLRPAAGWSYAAYVSELDRYRTAIAGAAPGVPIAGPDLSSTSWTLRYARAQGRRDVEITQHYYPLWACQGARPTISDLLGSRARGREDALLAVLDRASALAGHPGAISETNSVACNGSAAVSPRFASALWALDWALRAGRRGVRQVEFHNQFGPCTSRTYSPLCAAGAPAAAAGRLSAQPVFYGLVAAAGLEGGSFLPVAVQAPASITAYATREPGGKVHLAVDNLSPAGRPQAVIVALPARYRAAIERLAAPSVSARTGVRLAGAEVGTGGALPATPAAVPGGAGFLSLHLAPGSAALVTLAPAR